MDNFFAGDAPPDPDDAEQTQETVHPDTLH